MTWVDNVIIAALIVAVGLATWQLIDELCFRAQRKALRREVDRDALAVSTGVLNPNPPQEG